MRHPVDLVNFAVMEQNILEMYKGSRQRTLSVEEVAWLKDAIDKYPYFALPYQILARNSKGTDGSPNGPFLQKAAGFSPNRALLRAYLTFQEVSSVPVSPVEVPADLPKEEPTPVVESPTATKLEPKESVHDEFDWGLHTKVGLRVARHLPLSSKILSQIQEQERATRQLEAEAEKSVAAGPILEPVSLPEVAPEVEHELTDLGHEMEVDATSPEEVDASQLEVQLADQESVDETASQPDTEDFRDEESLENELNVSSGVSLQPSTEDVREPEQEQQEEEIEEEEELIRPLEFSARGLGPSRKLTSFTADSETDGDLDLSAQYQIGAYSSFSFLEAEEEGRYSPPPAPKPLLRNSEGAQEGEATEVVIKESGRVVEVQVTQDQLEKFFVPDLELEKLEMIEPEREATDENGAETGVKRHADAIIERFIEVEPSISRPDKNRTAGEDYSKPSVMEPEDLVTETLAWIHARQGNTQKAIRMYEKLKLRFPEKSDYFANLISKLKK